MEVRKRNGDIVPFDEQRIINAVTKSMTVGDGVDQKYIRDIICEIESLNEDILDISTIEQVIFNTLSDAGQYNTARAYENFRSVREFQRSVADDIEVQVNELVDGSSDYWNNENSNKNAKIVTTQRDYMAGILSTHISKKYLMSPELVQAHNEGIIHQHDMDYMAQNAISNCGLINLEDVLQNGTVINGVRIDKPHRLITATTIATQVITAVSSSQYGGVTISLTHLAPFVRMSYNRYVKKYRDRNLSADMVNLFAKEDLQKEIEDSVQTFNYQINSMSTTNGQAPFLSVMMYLDENREYTKEIAMLVEEFLKQRIKGMKNASGAYVTQAFPKLLYVLDSNNMYESSEYYYLTEMAAECTAKRMVPDYISAKIMKRDKYDVYPCMGCRSFLTPDRTKDNYANAKNYTSGSHKYYGRFNAGVCTLNLPDIALSSKGDLKTFWELFEERTEMCHKALKVKLDRLNAATSDVAPILWQDGAYARLPKHTPLTQLLYNGYATISLGYAGLYECVKYMTGESHTKKHGKELGLQIMQALNDKCNQWKLQENVDYSLYGSPIESTTYKFAKCLKKRFGVIKGITDKDYITNSYHVPVFEEIDPFTKLKLESEFQKLSPGGAISYIECADVTNNAPAVLEVLKYIYDNIMYAELNTKSDYCQACGYNGEIKIIDKNGELTWECPQCGNRDKDTLNVARRTCGYIGSNFWNQGRTQEIKERYVHLDDHVVKP